ncbi:MAG: FkbM family methyltransferase [Anaerolineaceae bacterium]|nr:MAG: FkbM family methyltransferase [Anaerolineaceae bacterium]
MEMKAVALKLTQLIVSIPHLPRRHKIAQAAYRRLLDEDAIVAGKIGSYKTSFDFADELQRRMYFGLYDQPEVQLMRHLLRPGHTFFDVGAHIGYYSLVASQLVGHSGHVHAFEPLQQNLARLEDVVAANQISNITANQFAIGSAIGSITLYSGPPDLANSGQSSVNPHSRLPFEATVSMITLDEYVSSRNIAQVSLVKLDIEGYEYEAFLGMNSLLREEGAPHLIFEVNEFLLNKLKLDSTILTEHLSDLGYSIFTISPFCLDAISPDKPLRNGVQNLFATKIPSGIGLGSLMLDSENSFWLPI